MKKYIFVALCFAAITLVCPAQDDPSGPPSNETGYFNAEGWVDVTEVTEPIQPNGLSGSGTGSGVSGGTSAIAEVITPEIQELARGLENDPKRIFDYVHDHIRHILYFGSKKGAQLTLLEQSGNDFDQCALLAALLRAAGYTNAAYEFGVLKMPYDAADGSNNDLHHWLGLTLLNTNWNATKDYFSYLLGTRGYPSNAFFTFSGDTNDLAFHRVWVTLPLSGTNYYLDPGFKITERISGIDLKSVTQANSNALWTAAGGTNTADYAQNLSESAIRNKLRDYTTNFLYFMQTNSNPNASVDEILGGGRIVSSANAKLSMSRPFPAYSGLDIVSWTFQPTNLMSSLAITLETSIETSNRFWFIPALGGERLSFVFATNGVGQFWLGDTVAIQTGTSTDQWAYAMIALDMPHGGWNTNSNTFQNSSLNDVTNLWLTFQRTNASYDLEYGFDVSPGRLHRAQDKLDSYRQQGYADSSRQVVSQTLQVMSLAWLLQTELLSRTLGSQLDILPTHHYRLMQVGAEHGWGYWVDAFSDLYATVPSSGHSGPDMQRLYRGIDLTEYFNSAFEHGVIEQLQSSNLVAASSINVLQAANANGTKVYRLAADNWNSVSNTLEVGYWPTWWFASRVFTNGLTVLLPQERYYQLGPNSAQAYAWISVGFAQNLRFIETRVATTFFGGVAVYTNAQPDPVFISQLNSGRPDAFRGAPVSVPQATGGDPVSMSDGAFRLNPIDLSLGSVEPLGITFTRHYSPTRRYVNQSGMTYGWTHNYCVNLRQVSAFEAGLGLTTPAQMAPMIAATTAAVELYGTNAVPKNWLTTALIVKWAVDQLITNGVSVMLGDDTLQFVWQPNGQLAPPANCTMTLKLSSGYYLLLERNDRSFLFDSSFRLSQLQDRLTGHLDISYLSSTSSLPQTVTDWKNRTLQFSYNNGVLTNVTDSTGRSVSYGYSDNGYGQLDLTSVTDLEGQTSRLVYDTNHQILKMSNAIPQLVVGNAYNSFGQVVTQYTAGDLNKQWQFFWSGYANTEQDPAGARRRFYLDDKHRFVGLQDALGNLWQTFYDGQDHPIATVSPLSETNCFIFDGRHNLTATLDALSFSNIFLFDTNDDLVGWVDELANTNCFGYNSQFQLTGATNAAGEWVTFSYQGLPLGGLLTNITTAGGSIGLGYDLGGYMKQITYPGGLGSEGFLNNALGDVLSWTNGRSFVTSFQYNQRRQLTNAIFPTNITFQIGRDVVGNPQTLTDARGFSVTNAWSATRKLLMTVFPGTSQGVPIVGNGYDNRDWLAQTTNALGKLTQLGFDSAGRLTSFADPLHRTNWFGLDVDGQLLTATNAALEFVQQQLNARGEVTNWIDPASHAVGSATDAAGNLASLTNRNSARWQFSFDKANRATNIVSPLLHTNSITFDTRGLPYTLREPSGNTATNSYDAKARLTNITDQAGVRLFKWDADDNLTNAVEGAASLAWTWDAYDLVSTYQDADGNLIQYKWDANGNLTNLIYPGSRVVKFAYNALNLVTNVTDWLNGQTTIDYDLAGKPTKITRPNGTIRIINYDDAAQVTNIVEKAANNAPIAFFKLDWNNAGHIDWEFAMHSQRANPPPLTNSMFFDADNRLTNFNNIIVTNDLDGNMIWGPLTNNTFVNFSYNARNWLLNGDSVSYGYDPLGNRTSLTQGTNITRFVVDPNTALSQVLIRTKNGVTNYYIYGLGLLYEITETAASTNRLYYHSDYRGSTIAITDQGGNVTDRAEYSAYGSVSYRSGTTDTPFWFNGRFGVQTDPNGLLYMRARYYNPNICRFINADPAGFDAGLNFYAFADGNPVSLVDPFGLGTGDADGGGYWTTVRHDAAHNLGALAGGFGSEARDTGVGMVMQQITDPLAVQRILGEAKGAVNFWQAQVNSASTLAFNPRGYLSGARRDLSMQADRVSQLFSDPHQIGRLTFVAWQMAMMFKGGSGGGSVRRTINVADKNIFYAEPVLDPARLAKVRPFNQALSDAKEPIRAVQTREGLYIFQGNHRVFGAVLDNQPVNMEIYTPEQYYQLIGQPFNPTPYVTWPDISPGRR
jgi:RHS repeat-associated protein